MESFISAKGIPVHLSITGKGSRTIVLLHGFLETLYIWEKFQEGLSSYYKVISIDLPGHGLSGSHIEVNSLDFTSNVLKEVLEYCNVSSSIIIGHSMGGYVAIQFAKMFPQFVENLVLINSTPFADSDDKKSERLREIDLIKSGKLLSIASISIPKMFAPDNVTKYDDIIEQVLELVEIHSPEGIIASIKGLMQRDDNLDFLINFNKPILIIAGKYDRFISQERIEFLKLKLDKANFLVLSNTGHIAFIEEEEITLDAIKTFLN